MPRSPDKRTGPAATPGPSHAVPAPTSTTQSIPDRDDPQRIGELLGDWLAIRMAEVDDLVAEAASKVEAIPDRRGLLVLIGELVIRVGAVEHELAELRKAARR